jgi:hypothetical protein
MSRTLSPLAKQAIFAQESGEAFILLLTITHASLAQPIRCANNMQDVVSGGNTFTAFPFRITLPQDREDRPPKMRLSIDNVDRSIVTAVRTLTSPPTIQLAVVLAIQPDTIEASFPGFTLRNTQYDALVVEGDLNLEDLANEPYPKDTFTPTFAPALFAWLLCVCGGLP